MAITAWKRVVNFVGGLIHHQPLWAAPLVLGVGVMVALGIRAFRFWVLGQPAGEMRSWIAETVGISIVIALTFGIYWLGIRGSEERDGGED